MIFLHQDATTGALSLVVVHDKPVDGSGGQVHVDGGDGATADDIVVVDGHTVALRAERQGGGDGRVCSVAMQIRDTAGNVGGRLPGRDRARSGSNE
jgi:hypothetical protein